MKKYLSFIIALILLFSFAACGAEKTTTDSTGSGQNGTTVSGTVTAVEGQKVTITTEEGKELSFSVNDATKYSFGTGDMPSGERPQGGNPPEMPSGDGQQGANPPEMPSGDGQQGGSAPEGPQNGGSLMNAGIDMLRVGSSITVTISAEGAATEIVFEMNVVPGDSK